MASGRESAQRKVELVGSDTVRVEFTIDELVDAMLHPGSNVAACNGCNHCMGAEIGPVEEGGVRQ